MSYPNIASFLGVDPANVELRETVRQDLLIERYADLQQEMEHLENLLGLSSAATNEDEKNLHRINEMLFHIIETVVPELLTTTEKEDGVVVSEGRAARMKAREHVIMSLMNNNKEDYVLAKESIEDGMMSKARNCLDNIISS